MASVTMKREREQIKIELTSTQLLTVGNVVLLQTEAFVIKGNCKRRMDNELSMSRFARL